MPPPVVVLDANVLIPAGLRDLILRAAEQRLCEIRWSDDILAEVERHLPDFIVADGADEGEIGRIKREKAAQIVTAMRHAFPDMLVTNYQRHIAEMTNDLKDRHIAAAAFEAGADLIVTFNLMHFKPPTLIAFNLRAISPDIFLMQLFRADSDTMAKIIRDMERDLTRPPRTAAQLLDGLMRIVPVFARTMRAYMEL